jgi:hypothetical protein
MIRRQTAIVSFGEGVIPNVADIEICSPYGVIIKFVDGEEWKFARNEAYTKEEKDGGTI